MSELTKSELKDFRTDFGKVIEEIEKKYKLQVKLGNISFGKYDFSVKLTGKRDTEEANQTYAQREETFFKSVCTVYGLEPSDFGRKFRQNGKTFKIVGINARAPKNPIKLIDDNGVTYRSPAESIKFYLNAMPENS